MVEDTGCVDGLEAQHLVIEVAYKQTLGRKSVRLNVDIRTTDAAEKAALANVRVAANQKCACVRINTR